MTCKDCIHYEACGEYIMTDMDQDVWHYATEGRTDEIPDIEVRCNEFKDKSRYIELPCKVGDTVFTIVTGGKFIHSAKVVGFHLGKFPTLRGHARKEYLVCYTDYCLRHIDIAQIGKTAFFTREEAEKVLAERTTTPNY